MRSAVFCGSFDPFTLGHLDILKKAGRIFDKVYVALPLAGGKRQCNLPNRIKIAKDATKCCEFAEVVTFSGLLTEFCKAMKVYNIVRGMRNANDFIYESDLLRNYQSQCDKIDCTYFMADNSLSHVSSSAVRELAALGGNIENYVTENTLSLVKESYGKIVLDLPDVIMR